MGERLPAAQDIADYIDREVVIEVLTENLREKDRRLQEAIQALWGVIDTLTRRTRGTTHQKTQDIILAVQVARVGIGKATGELK